MKNARITSQNVQPIDKPKSPQLARVIPTLHADRVPHSFHRIEVPAPWDAAKVVDVVEVLTIPGGQHLFVSNRRGAYGPVAVEDETDIVYAFNANAHRIV